VNKREARRNRPHVITLPRFISFTAHQPYKETFFKLIKKKRKKKKKRSGRPKLDWGIKSFWLDGSRKGMMMRKQEEENKKRKREQDKNLLLQPR
jgi:hypothetical protein